MTTLSTRSVYKIGIDPPQPANPDDHELYRYDSQGEDDGDCDVDESESEYEYQASGTENDSEVSDTDYIERVPFFKFNKQKKDVNCYTVILQEEEFVPE